MHIFLFFNFETFILMFCHISNVNYFQALRMPPKKIITDEDTWMSVAITSEMRTTKHSYCM